MADPWKSQVVEGQNLCPICKSSSSIEVDGETVDVTIEDGEAYVFEEVEGDEAECQVCETTFEVNDDDDG